MAVLSRFGPAERLGLDEVRVHGQQFIGQTGTEPASCCASSFVESCCSLAQRRCCPFPNGFCRGTSQCLPWLPSHTVQIPALRKKALSWRPAQVFVDVTQEVDRRVAHGCAAARFHGHVWRNDAALTSDTHHRPQDLRVIERRSSSGDNNASGTLDGTTAWARPASELAACSAPQSPLHAVCWLLFRLVSSGPHTVRGR